MACAFSAPSGTHGSRAANTDAPLAVSLYKFIDKAKNFEQTDDKAASNSRLIGAYPYWFYPYYGYGSGFGYANGYYGRKRSAEAGHFGYGYGIYDKREAVDTKMLQKIKNTGKHGPKYRDLSWWISCKFSCMLFVI